MEQSLPQISSNYSTTITPAPITPITPIRNTSYTCKQAAMTIHESNQQQNNMRRLDSPIPNEQSNINNNNNTNNNNSNKQSIDPSIESNISSQADFQINNSNNNGNNNNNNNNNNSGNNGNNNGNKNSNNNGNNNNSGNLQHVPSTSTISRTPTNSKYNDEDIYSEMEFEKFKPSICTHFIMFILITVLCSGAFYYNYLYEWPHKIYYGMSYAAILWFLYVLFLFHEFFSGLCNHRGGMIFIGLTIIFGLIESLFFGFGHNFYTYVNNISFATTYQMLFARCIDQTPVIISLTNSEFDGPLGLLLASGNTETYISDINHKDYQLQQEYNGIRRDPPFLY